MVPGLVSFVILSSHLKEPLIVDIPTGVHNFQAAGPDSGWLKKYESDLATRGNGEKIVLRFARGYHEFQSAFFIHFPNITIQGEPGTVLSGGPRVTAWHPVTDLSVLARLPKFAIGHVVEYNPPQTNPNSLGPFIQRGFGYPDQPSFSELFQNGEPLIPARYPSQDPSTWLHTGKVTADRSFLLADSEPTKWLNFDNVWTYGYWKFDWAESWEPVQSYANGIVTLLNNSTGPIKDFGLGADRRFYFSNVLEELNQPGEFVLDTPHNRIYAWLREGSTKDVVLSLMDQPMIFVKDTQNVSISGLELEGDRSTLVKINDCKGVVVRNCLLHDSGDGGVAITGGDHCGVRNCKIVDLGSFGVSLSGGDRKTLARGDHYVEGCTIERIARLCRTYQPAVTIAGVGQRVVGNVISDLPHQAILFNGNDHLIERNDIRRVCMETGDAGAIYAGRDTTTRGTMIKWNRFREIEPHIKEADGSYTGVMSVYLDDCQAGISIVGNIFESKDTAIMIGGGRDNVVEGNIFLGSNPGLDFDQRGRGWAKDFFKNDWGMKAKIAAVPALESPWKEHYPKLYWDLLNKVDFSFASGNKVDGNVIVTSNWIRYLDGLSQKDLIYQNNDVLKNSTTLKEALETVSSLHAPIPLNRIGKP